MNDIQITFIIKALNEENNIAACIESCIREAQPYLSEIILVDALSTDNTIRIAKQYPIRIVQFLDANDIGCGATAQLGYQHATGKYIFLIDGDMEVCDGFLDHALKFLDENLEIAGVGGKLLDTQIFSAEDQRRADSYQKLQELEFVSHLGGGGVYRKSSIESVRYFSHRGLKAFEEAELGLRLSCKGLKLARISKDAVLHTGHSETGLQRLKRQWRNGRLAAHGTFIRGALRKKWWLQCFKQMWFVFAPLFINLLIISFLVISSVFVDFTVLHSIVFFITSWLGVLFLLTIKRGNLNVAAFSIITWHAALVAAIFSFRKKVKSPYSKIESCELFSPTDFNNIS
ncbi:glycosyltransferase [Pseudoalteromonas denitrificans]|uniref:Glycosyltransferase, catalytic subunit of cellulose synthase and poly-beta-1,6-N-acetylglucosamine synthase n=1 Tax=Pseudoalteromonas denitrificans DSM 6059 TaxID=1123010 RepID=A0A1I1FDI8_9GAMM|nr:glycosyltransferase family 2 protein [Pseudoalteromonas denitrificans]SFB95778.1 Glycosyltransferase, catalytic subunit of cellulose synthase and poly-beta-1,6-N-acetylglucosamine synthase [Pseudoalteromonas denitrificans DSM 6059]